MQEKYKWFLVLGVSAVVLVIAVLGALSDYMGEPEEEQKKSIRVRKLAPSLPVAAIREKLDAATIYVAPDPVEKVKNVIASHSDFVEANRDSEEAPAYLQAMGNLAALRLGDHEKAAYYYQQVLDLYPDYKGRLQVYPQLATAYEKAGDRVRAKRVYREMINLFPEDSSEHQWAADQLGTEQYEGPTVMHPGSPEEAEYLKKRAAALAAVEAERKAAAEADEGE